MIELTERVFDAKTASLDVLMAVQAHNPDSLWAILETSAGGAEKLVGFYAFLMLNTAGHDALLARTIDTTSPDLTLLSKDNERPEAVYTWGVIAPGLMAFAGPRIGAALKARGLYEGLPNYGGIATEAGLRTAHKTGSRPLTEADNRIGGLWVVDQHVPDRERLLKRQKAAAERGTNRKLDVVVVSTAEQLMQAFQIRASVFSGEQHCPLDEEFDGNDYTCTHFLGLVDGRPAATMRMRYFGDGVKIERIALLPQYRKVTGMARLIAQTVIAHARRKGFRAVYGTAQSRFAGFWRELGFEIREPAEALVFSDHAYVEIYRELEDHPSPVTLRSDPFVLMRPEGDWDRPGVLDRSASRPPTNPH